MDHEMPVVRRWLIKAAMVIAIFPLAGLFSAVDVNLPLRISAALFGAGPFILILAWCAVALILWNPEAEAKIGLMAACLTFVWLAAIAGLQLCELPTYSQLRLPNVTVLDFVTFAFVATALMALACRRAITSIMPMVLRHRRGLILFLLLA